LDSLALRFTVAITVAATLPSLAMLLPTIHQGSFGAGPSVLLGAGVTLALVGMLGLSAWLLTRALLRPLMALIDDMNPLNRSLPKRAAEPAQRLPLEVGLLHAIVGSREAAHRRQAEERSTYVSTLIHDMKTPLLAVGRSLDLALAEPDYARRRAWLLATSDEVKRLLGLVQDVVDTERLSRGALQLRWASIDLVELVRRVADRVERTRDDVAVSVTARTSHLHRGDAALLERAVENIVANGVHHARSRVDVEIMAGLVRVSDDGPGMPSDTGTASVQPSSPHESAVSPPDARRSSGLGLFIARQVAEAHGGRVVLEATGELGTSVLLYVGAPTQNGALSAR
jgi:signal transduction histidine kinase